MSTEYGYPIATPASSVIVYPDHTAPLLPLDEWRRLMGFNPWHFWQFNDPQHENTSACNSTVWEYSWQGARSGAANAAGRADIIEALLTAENKLKLYTGYSFAPRFEFDEVPWPHTNGVRGERWLSVGASGRRAGVRVRSGKIQALGVPARSLIDGAAAVTRSDPDGDGLKERFTLSVTTSVTDPNEIAVYFVAADRLDGDAVSEKWRVQPVSVTISGGTATIIGRAWTIGKPILHQGQDVDVLDPTDDANYPTTLAVYRYYADTTDQGAFVWDSVPGTCCEGNIDPSYVNASAARYTIADGELGYVAGDIASYNTSTALWEPAQWPVAYEPNRVRVSYLAGSPLTGGQMNTRNKEIVARLAAAELARAICACTDANMEMHRWQFDRARSAGANEEQYSLGDKDLNNPLGVREGQIWAWNQIKQLALAGASLA